MEIKSHFFLFSILLASIVLLSSAHALTTVTSCGQPLNIEGETYQLDRDISSAGSCLTYGANNVVLDLNGYTITFDTAHTGGTRGVLANNYDNLILTSSNGQGKIIQDLNCPLTTSECSGDRAISFGGNEGSTIENIYVGVQGYDTHGIFISGGTRTRTFFNVFNNTINHSGTTISSRGGFTSMPMKVDKVYFPMNISYNAILDSPHAGIMFDNNAPNEGAMDGSDLAYNYMDIDDAYYANPTGIIFYRGHAVNIHHNLFVGDGMEGIQIDGFLMEGTNRTSIHDNFLNLSTIRWPAGQSSGPGSMQGIRIRYSAKYLDIYNNHVIGRATVSPYEIQNSAFGLWFDCTQSTNDCTDVKIWNNTFEAYTDGTPTGGYGEGGIGHAVGVAFTGIGPASDVEFWNNSIKSNNEALVFYDGVITDMNGLQFHDNTLEIVSPSIAPRTIVTNWIETPPMRLVLRDTSFLGDASKTDFSLIRSTDTITYEWGLQVVVTEDSVPITDQARLIIVDSELSTVYDDVSTNGVFPVQYLKEWTSVSSGITNTYSPYNLTVEYKGEAIVREVTMDSTKTETFDFVLGPCSEGATRQCGKTDVGACSYGIETCTGGVWGSCVGEVSAIPEICDNSLDDDCDTLTDYDDTEDCTVPECTLPADVSPCNIIEAGELINAVLEWYAGNTDITTLLTVVDTWKVGAQQAPPTT